MQQPEHRQSTNPPDMCNEVYAMNQSNEAEQQNHEVNPKERLPVCRQLSFMTSFSSNSKNETKTPHCEYKYWIDEVKLPVQPVRSQGRRPDPPFQAPTSATMYPLKHHIVFTEPPVLPSILQRYDLFSNGPPTLELPNSKENKSLS